MSLTLLVLAAGLGSRFGGLKQLAPVGPNGEAIPDLNAAAAAAAGFDRAVVIVRTEIEEQVRAHVDRRWPAAVDVRYVAQDRDPAARQHPRPKPLGTVHAVLAAAPLIDGPFAVINADDLYGGEAFGLLGAHLASDDEHCLVTYQVAKTILGSEPVTRALCRVEGGHLVGVDEGRIGPGKDDAPLTWSDGTTNLVLRGDEPVSMNCWGFQPSILPALQAAFGGFLAGGSVEAGRESLLPTVVGDLLPAPGGVAMAALASTGACLGVTHAADEGTLRARLAVANRS